MQRVELMSAMAATPWALQPEFLQHMQSVARTMAEGGEAANRQEAALKANVEIEAARRQQISASTGGSVVVLPLYGLITQRYSWMTYYFGGTTTEGFTMQLRQALADPNVTAIVIDVDSPGGSVAGVDELAAEIFAARGKKTIVAISNTLNASAAYYLSSQASELYVMPSSLTGSIGVYNAHHDISAYLAQMGVKITLVSAGRFKVENNGYEPLNETGLAAMQKLVDGYYDQFVAAVARGRKVKASAVKAGFGEGRVVMAPDAIASGMADKIGTLDTVLARFGVQRTANDSFLAETSESAPAAAVIEPAAETAPEAIPTAAKADDGTDTDEDGDEDQVCACDCDPCTSGDCSGCTADDCAAEGCSCKALKTEKTKAEHERALALQRRRVALACE